MLELSDDQTTIHDQLSEGTSFTLAGETAGAYYVIVSVSDVGVLAERYVLDNTTHVKQSTRFFTWATALVLVLPN
ncbi:hypothetical protein [Nonomuraea zeae]|uniref:hypothetical protein n=1 Tax=Nonomuraea zeae TaxID=1642303 RepID=UPI0036143D11